MRPLAILLLVPLAALAACGNERAEAPTAGVAGGGSVKPLEYPRYGVEVSVPSTASVQETEPPGVFRLFLGEPLVSMFAYSRKEQIPRKPEELRQARRRLIKEVERRDPDYELRSSRITEVAGAKAIELVGDQTISRGLLRTRSVHVYKRKAEYVVELLAPPEKFRSTDREVFDPLLDSLKLTGKIKAVKRKKKQE